MPAARCTLTSRTSPSGWTGHSSCAFNSPILTRCAAWWALAWGWRPGVALPVPRVMQEIRFDALGEHVAGRSVPASEATLPGSLLAKFMLTSGQFNVAQLLIGPSAATSVKQNGWDISVVATSAGREGRVDGRAQLGGAIRPHEALTLERHAAFQPLRAVEVQQLHRHRIEHLVADDHAAEAVGQRIQPAHPVAEARQPGLLALPQHARQVDDGIAGHRVAQRIQHRLGQRTRTGAELQHLARFTAAPQARRIADHEHVVRPLQVARRGVGQRAAVGTAGSQAATTGPATDAATADAHTAAANSSTACSRPTAGAKLTPNTLPIRAAVNVGASTPSSARTAPPTPAARP